MYESLTEIRIQVLALPTHRRDAAADDAQARAALSSGAAGGAQGGRQETANVSGEPHDGPKSPLQQFRCSLSADPA